MVIFRLAHTHMIHISIYNMLYDIYIPSVSDGQILFRNIICSEDRLLGAVFSVCLCEPDSIERLLEYIKQVIEADIIERRYEVCG